VHGLFADGSCWSEVIARLQAAGLNATAVLAKEINVSAFSDHGVVIATQHGRLLRLGEIPLAEVGFFISLEPIAIGWVQQ
jgi:hypothetical protein